MLVLSYSRAPESRPGAAACAASRTALCHSASSRACWTLRCFASAAKAASVSGVATSASGATRSNENAPDASPAFSFGSDSRWAPVRTHCRAVGPLTPHCCVTHDAIDTAPSPRHPSTLSSSATSATCSACSTAMHRDRSTMRAANSFDRGSRPYSRHGGRRRIRFGSAPLLELPAPRWFITMRRVSQRGVTTTRRRLAPLHLRHLVQGRPTPAPYPDNHSRLRVCSSLEGSNRFKTTMADI